MGRFNHYTKDGRFENEQDAHIATRKISTAHSSTVGMEYRFVVDKADITTFNLVEVWTTRRQHWVDDDGKSGEAVLENSEYDIPQELVEELIRDHGADKVVSEVGVVLGELILDVGNGQNDG